MSVSWIDYPIGVMAAAVRITVGGLLFSASACIIGTWMYEGLAPSLLGMWAPSIGNLLDSLQEATFSFPFIVGLGVLTMYGIPLVLVQWACIYQIVWGESKLLRSWFVIAYCQAVLTCLWDVISTGVVAWDWRTQCVVISLSMLGVVNGFLAWLIKWRIRTF